MSTINSCRSSRGNAFRSGAKIECQDSSFTKSKPFCDSGARRPHTEPFDFRQIRVIQPLLGIPPQHFKIDKLSNLLSDIAKSVHRCFLRAAGNAKLCFQKILAKIRFQRASEGLLRLHIKRGKRIEQGIQRESILLRNHRFHQRQT